MCRHRKLSLSAPGASKNTTAHFILLHRATWALRIYSEASQGSWRDEARRNGLRRCWELEVKALGECVGQPSRCLAPSGSSLARSYNSNVLA